jgi:hypothetical protein
MRVTFEICGVIANNVAGSFTNISMRFACCAHSGTVVWGHISRSDKVKSLQPTRVQTFYLELGVSLRD